MVDAGRPIRSTPVSYPSRRECTAINVGGAEPGYFFDPSSPPLDTWDFSPSGPWMMVAGDYPALRPVAASAARP
jgi:hypothetical protein